MTVFVLKSESVHLAFKVSMHNLKGSPFKVKNR